MSDLTSQPLFHKIGTKVPATVRFSTVAGESGSAETARDVHGFAIKLKTEQGILDWVCLNTPTFFISDPAKYPDLVHATKRNPQTNLKDHNIYWDFFSQNPETIHEIMMLFSDRGTPNGFHHQHGFGGTTFKWTKSDGSYIYTKLHVRLPAGQKVQTLSAADATRLAGENPDYNTQALYNDIEAGRYPRWDVFIQTMEPPKPECPSHEWKWAWLAFDVTKIWPQRDFPLHKIGELVLNENPKNYFDEIEQLGFSPSHLIPYIEPSPDPLFQSRLFIYPDTQRYRLGVNNKQIPCNAPNVKLSKKEFPHPTLAKVANHQRAGAAVHVSQGNRPNYQSTIQSLNFVGPLNAIDSQIRNNKRDEIFDGSVYRDMPLPSDLSARDFQQPKALWDLWTDDEKTTFVNNISPHLGAASLAVKINQLFVFNAVDRRLAERIAHAMHVAFVVPPWNPIVELEINLRRIKKDLPQDVDVDGDGDGDGDGDSNDNNNDD
jgi:catalase